MKQVADVPAPGQQLSSRSGPPSWHPPTPGQAWAAPPGAPDGPATWAPPPPPPGPPVPPPGWNPPPNGPPPGGWPRPPGGPPNGPRYSVAGIIAVVIGLFVLLVMIGAALEDNADAEASRADGASQTSPTAPSTEPPAPPPGLGDGTYRVGSDIAPGLYRADGADGCYWKRLNSLSGGFGAILANDNAVGQVYVELLPTDVAFATQDCGRWLPADASGPDVSSRFGDGTYLVGSDIQPGTYRTEGADGCYWKRLSSLSGGFGAILANDNAVGQVYVEVLPTDVAFAVQDCGAWTRIG